MVVMLKTKICLLKLKHHWPDIVIVIVINLFVHL